MNNTKQIMYHAANGVMCEWTREDDVAIVNRLTTDDFNFLISRHRAKLCLRPLSQLTESITHNGETFVPMERIVKVLGFDTEINSWYGTPRYIFKTSDYVIIYNLDKACFEVHNNGIHLNENSLISEVFSIKLFEYLLSLHFNIYQLENTIDVTNEFNPY